MIIGVIISEAISIPFAYLKNSNFNHLKNQYLMMPSELFQKIYLLTRI